MLATTTKEMREGMTSEMLVMCIAAATSNAMVVTTAGAETTVATETTAETTGVKDNVNAAGAAAPPANVHVNDRGPLSGMYSVVMDTVGMKSGMSSENPVESPSCASRTSMRSSTKLWCAHRCLSPDDFFRGGLVFARRQLFSTFSELPGVTGLKHVKIDRDRAEAVVYFMSGDDAKLAASQVRHSLVACACTPLLTSCL